VPDRIIDDVVDASVAVQGPIKSNADRGSRGVSNGEETRHEARRGWVSDFARFAANPANAIVSNVTRVRY
jgi:hypothetical protein